MNDVVVMETKVVEYSATAQALAVLDQRYRGVVFNVSDKHELQQAKAARAEIKGYRVALEKKRVEIKAPALERTRLIDDEARRITAALSALEVPIDDQIKADERAKEAERVERETRVRGQIDRIKGIPAALIGQPAAAVTAALTALEDDRVDSAFYGEFFDAAMMAQTASLASLATMQRVALDAEAAEDRLRLRQADLDRQEAVQRAREQEEAGRRAEAQRLADEDLAARRRLLEAEEARLAEERRVREAADRKARLEQEARERAARERKEAKEAKARARLGDRELLADFRKRHVGDKEFAGIVLAIDCYFADTPS